jgi:hypothetical protein
VTLLTLALATAVGVASPVGADADGALRLTFAADAPLAAPAASSQFDFDLLPEKPKSAADLLLAQEIDHEFLVRRRVLKLHQAFGIATVALLAATVVIGQLSYSDKFGGPDSGKYEVWHDCFEAAATVSFATTGLLALFAPVPFPKKTNGTMLVHKISMLTATAGFVAEIILGIVTVSLEGHENQQTLATAHLITGYSTAAATATGVGALFFP